jgi:hypothetical protein
VTRSQRRQVTRVHVIDVDRIDSCPPEARAWVDDWADRVRSTSAAVKGFANDLEAPSDETGLLGLLAPYQHRAYHHATRLLDHEVAAIKEQNMRLLTPDLVVERIESALRHEDITTAHN